ncbi:acyltransferase family protein [Billgrantia lactosivorans]|uniref:acyltransferase family protein n=1 Tax=Billgrantia lactosivorans TaxID=2185141 RepID=UPI0013A6A24A|nr:acyltransferase family protein [Halomonas lactosivorans]
MPKPQYRPDIDGLRAIAVTLVVAYHAGVPGLGFGFIGVDVFFVISGYLITSLLLRELEHSGRISLLAFYGRRVRRLMPAMVVVIAASLVLGQVLLTPVGQQQGLAESAIASLAFFANYYFSATTGGYFDGPTDQVPLLHMWSLSVEEQFYAVWPVLLIVSTALAKRHGKRPWAVIVTLATLGIGASFGYGLWLADSNPNAAYFSVLSRGWQLLAGSLLACVVGRGLLPRLSIGAQSVLAGSGAALLLAAAFVIESSHAYPGWVGMLPVLSALALIVAGAGRGPNPLSRLLSTRPFVLVGQVSYPWYLWHWPLLAMARAYHLGQGDLMRDLLLAGLALGLAFLTYGLVEKPVAGFFSRRSVSHKQLVRLGGLSSLLLALAAFGLMSHANQQKSEGFYQQLERAAEDMPDLRDGCHLSLPFQGLPDAADCVNRPAAAAPDLLLWGDSHADHYSPMLDELADDLGFTFLQRTFSTCPPLLGYSHGYEEGHPRENDRHCELFKGAMKGELARLAEGGLSGVVLSASWLGRASSKTHIDQAEEGLRNTVGMLLGHGLRVIVVAPTPVFSVPVTDCLARRTEASCNDFQRRREKRREAMLEVMHGIAEEEPNVRVVDFQAQLCPGGRCHSILGDTVVYRDEHHLTTRAARQLSATARDEVRWLLEAPGA